MVPRSALGGYSPVRTRLVVDRTRLAATLFRDRRRGFRPRVGIGAPGTTTPGGDFYVRNRLEKYQSPFYGPIALALAPPNRGQRLARRRLRRHPRHEPT